MREINAQPHQGRFPEDAPIVSFWLHRLGQLEAAYRETAGRLLETVGPETDTAATIRRALDRFEH